MSRAAGRIAGVARSELAGHSYIKAAGESIEADQYHSESLEVTRSIASGSSCLWSLSRIGKATCADGIRHLGSRQCSSHVSVRTMPLHATTKRLTSLPYESERYTISQRVSAFCVRTTLLGSKMSQVRKAASHQRRRRPRRASLPLMVRATHPSRTIGQHRGSASPTEESSSSLSLCTSQHALRPQDS